MTKLAVLLRAVNVGGRKVALAQFKTALKALGLEGAKTLGVAGTAVGAAKDGAGLEGRLEAGLAEALGGALEVFVRDGGQLAQVVAQNPYPQMAKDDPSHLVVLFLKGEPEADAVAALQEKIKGREVVAAGPGCLYACYPDGIGESKLTLPVIERALAVRGTGRNWNTVRKLAELTA